MELTETEKFIKSARAAHGDRFDYSKTEYVKSGIPVIIICAVHGEFFQKPVYHLSKTKNGKSRGCHKCGPAHKHTQDEWVQKAVEIHGDKYDYSQSVYRYGKQKITIRCKKHGNFEQQASSHIGKDKCGCPRCGFDKGSSLRVKDTVYFINKSKEAHGNYYDYSLVDYKNRSTEVTIICPKHGQFIQLPFNHYQGKGCSTCNISTGETKVARQLEYLGYEYEQQKKFPDCKNIHCLPFDFYIPAINTIIEFDGRQHYEPVDRFGGEEFFKKTQHNDAIKNKFAADTGKHIFRIRYDQDVSTEIDNFLSEM